MLDEVHPINNYKKIIRFKRRQSLIHDSDEIVAFFHDEVTNIHNTGDIETVETDHSIILNGERISTPADIVGRCQIPECSRYVTHRTAKYCFYCGLVMCVRCSTWDETDERWLCPLCHRSLRRKRIRKAIVRALLSPFRRKNNE